MTSRDDLIDMGHEDCEICQQARESKHTFQRGVELWMDQCFVPSLYSNMVERGDRFLEEALEMLQANGYPRERIATLVDYVWSRPKGELGQEVGGVMVTLAGYCWIAGLDMHEEGARELKRITQPEVMAKIRAKQEAKNALHFDTPLPGSLLVDVPTVRGAAGVVMDAMAVMGFRRYQVQPVKDYILASGEWPLEDGGVMMFQVEIRGPHSDFTRPLVTQLIRDEVDRLLELNGGRK